MFLLLKTERNSCSNSVLSYNNIIKHNFVEIFNNNFDLGAADPGFCHRGCVCLYIGSFETISPWWQQHINTQMWKKNQESTVGYVQ